MSVHSSRPRWPAASWPRDVQGVAVAAGLILLALAAAALVAHGALGALAPDGSRDTQWSGAHLLWLGQDPTRLFLACRLGCADNPFILSQYPNYPISALALLAPLGALPWPAAKLVWLMLTLASTGVLLWLAPQELAPRLDRRWTMLAGLLLLISTPYRNHLANGQEGIFALAMFVLALRLARTQHATLAGFVLALAWVKFTLTMPLCLVFVARRDWRVLAIAGVSHLALTVAAAAWTHTGLVASVFGFLHVAGIAVSPIFGFLDVFALASHFGWPMAVAIGLAASLAGAGVALAWRAGRENEALLLAVAGLVTMAAFYHLSYDAVIFFFPLLYALQALQRPAARGQDLVLPALIVATVALTWLGDRVVAGNAAGFELGGPGYRWFYGVMAALFYAAVGAGLYRLGTVAASRSGAVAMVRARPPA